MTTLRIAACGLRSGIVAAPARAARAAQAETGLPLDQISAPLARGVTNAKS